MLDEVKFRIAILRNEMGIAFYPVMFAMIVVLSWLLSFILSKVVAIVVFIVTLLGLAYLVYEEFRQKVDAELGNDSEE